MKEKYFVSLEFKDTDLAAAHQIMQQVSGLCNYPFSMQLKAMPSEKGKK